MASKEERQETRAQIMAYAMYYIGKEGVMDSRFEFHAYPEYDAYQFADAVASTYTNQELDAIIENDNVDSDEVYRRVEKCVPNWEKRRSMVCNNNCPQAEGRIKMDVSKEEDELISKIVDRFLNMLEELNAEHHINVLKLTMDITICHANDTPLDLQGLLEADSLDFMHDVGGIRENMNRKIGKLDNFFVPRYAGQIVSKGV